MLLLYQEYHLETLALRDDGLMGSLVEELCKVEDLSIIQTIALFVELVKNYSVVCYLVVV